jgi:hypothetical protein
MEYLLIHLKEAKTVQQALGKVLEASEQANGCRAITSRLVPKQTSYHEHLCPISHSWFKL